MNWNYGNYAMSITNSCLKDNLVMDKLHNLTQAPGGMVMQVGAVSDVIDTTQYCMVH